MFLEPSRETSITPMQSGPPVSLHSGDNRCPRRFIYLATNILAEHDLTIPKRAYLETIVCAALAAQYLFYTAALYGPTPAELDAFVEGFVLRCVSGDQINTSAVRQRPSEARYQHCEVEV